MNSTRTAVAALIVLGLASVAAGQEHEAQAARERTRHAQPRERAPRAEPPRADTARAEAPARARAEAPAPVHHERAAERSRGSDDQGRVRAPRNDNADRGDRGESRAEARERAVPRAAPMAPITRTEPRREPPAVATVAPPSERRERAAPSDVAPPAIASSASASDDDGQRRRDDGEGRAVPRGSRPRGDNPAVGRAVPRDGGSSVRGGRGGRVYSGGGSRVYTSRGGVYTSRGRVYNNYYYSYPRRWYPYGYGAFGGLGYFYYDPYTWYSYDPYWSRPHSYYYGGYSYGGYSRYDDDYYYTGELRLQVHPRHAEVYVDGYFAGNIDDFDGIFQALRIEEGPHTIEISAPGYETLEFEIRIIPGRKITYRAELRPRP